MDQEDFIKASPLGQQSAYITHYDASLLCPIPRQQPRHKQRPFYGVDIWNAYEISWLDTQGVPQIALAECRIAGDSPHIIESKSFKCYLHSFHQTAMASRNAVQARIQADISTAAGMACQVTLFDLDTNAIPLVPTPGQCIDTCAIDQAVYQPDASLLGVHVSQYRTETLHSHLLKSNCPVTGQPDWATLVVDYQGTSLDRAKLLQYIISYREYSDFHEQCVERIFLDITAQCQPRQLTVYARYLRRGGLDINPYRSTQPLNPLNQRTERQ